MAIESQTLEILRSLPGAIRTSGDPALLAAFASDESGRRGETPMAVAHPTSVEDVQAIIGWATRHSLHLVPVSSPGGPRRRGDTVCDRTCVIIDMSGMQRVIHVDGADAVAIIEPGVTFPVLNLALRGHGLRTYQPLAPRASKSVLSAFLEREPMTVPGRHWDVADPLASMELVLGTGDLFRTGGAAMPGSLEENLKRGNRQLIAPGPSFTDFGRVMQGAQGSLGIVTWASILCQRVPTVEVPLFASAVDLAPIVDLCYCMLRRRPAGQLFIVNNVQLALLLADDARSYASLRDSLPPWLLYVELSAAAYFPDEAIAYQRADLERDALRLGAKVSSALAGRSAGTLAERQRAFSDVAPHRRAALVCQEVFAVSRLDAAEEQSRAITSLMAEHGEVAVYLQPMIQGVNAHCQFTLLDQPGREMSLSRLAVTAAETLTHHHGFLSRPYHPWSHVPFACDKTIGPFLAQTKAMFDPHNILQPGSMSLGSMQ